VQHERSRRFTTGDKSSHVLFDMIAGCKCIVTMIIFLPSMGALGLDACLSGCEGDSAVPSIQQVMVIFATGEPWCIAAR
jgi:hypothetical protein